MAGWSKAKADEIYGLIPDFGGFLVKANSEGQPGPKTYGRTHADGANVLADALVPHKGNVMWRAFVYDDDIDPDRAKHTRRHKEVADRLAIQVADSARRRDQILECFGRFSKRPIPRLI